MAKKGSASKRLEALERAQQIDQALKSSTIESEALLSSAGESRPTLESHVLDLLDQRFIKEAEAGDRRRKAAARRKAGKAQRRGKAGKR